ncbi:PfkB family carbohydrate kinase [Psychromonas sp. SA13A]|uniref:PfkB family carbohydrate kinase n=1 Tax=Psychromonas sp. SA13A TaxID=2686346 RepID=UPI001407F3CF|nr:PfkB family carbohydrate kinase [Psychromonas sp. SA13A]
MSILTIGLTCFDQFFFVNEYPKENSKYVATDYYESGGGPTANAAYLLGVWGEKCFHTGYVGNDIYGERIIEELKSVGVNTSLITKNVNYPTPLANITVNTDTGSRTIILRKSSHIADVSKFTIPPDLECDVILIDGREQELSEKIIHQFPDAKVVMDGGSLRISNLQLAKLTDYMVVSESFALAHSNMKEFTTKEDLLHALINLKKICRGYVVITLGERGCAYLDYRVLLSDLKNKSALKNINQCKDGLIVIVPSYKSKNPIDTTGAGDIFHGAFAYGVSKKWSIDKIINFASKTAAISVGKKGVRTSIPTLDVVETSKYSKDYDFFNAEI